MITCKLHNGLGNQMFQVAATYALAKRNNDTAVFDLKKGYKLTQGKSPSAYIDTIYRNLQSKKILPSTVYKESAADDLLEVFPYKDIEYKPGMMIDGNFQSEKYFEDCKEDIKNLFVLGDIKKEDDDPVTTAVCVRRGDYLDMPDKYVLLTEQYYREAMHVVGESAFIFISDDIEWCKNTFSGDNIFYSPLTNDVEQMQLISLCTNVILANSTFGWWGAWLGENEKSMIIGPKKWFTVWDDSDIMPERWIKL